MGNRSTVWVPARNVTSPVNRLIRIDPGQRGTVPAEPIRRKSRPMRVLGGVAAGFRDQRSRRKPLGRKGFGEWALLGSNQ